MLHQDRVNALRQTHSTMSTIMPVLTAGLTVAGAMLAAFEARSASAAEARARKPASETAGEAVSDPTSATPAPRAAARYRVYSTSRPVSVRHYVAILAGRLLMVVLGLGLTLAIIYAATATGRIGQAVTITALILLTLYLVEKVARQA